MGKNPSYFLKLILWTKLSIASDGSIVVIRNLSRVVLGIATDRIGVISICPVFVLTISISAVTLVVYSERMCEKSSLMR